MNEGLDDADDADDAGKPPDASLAYLNEYFELAVCSVISVICSVTHWKVGVWLRLPGSNSFFFRISMRMSRCR